MVRHNIFNARVFEMIQSVDTACIHSSTISDTAWLVKRDNDTTAATNRELIIYVCVTINVVRLQHARIQRLKLRSVTMTL